jgi:hypothetical protein
MSEPGMQVHKPWCLLSSTWVGLGNMGRQQFSKKVITDIFELPKKYIYLSFKFYFPELSMTYTKPIKMFRSLTTSVWPCKCTHRLEGTWLEVNSQTCWLVEPVAYLRSIKGRIWISRGTVIGWEHSNIQTSPLRFCSQQISPEH